MANVEDEEVAGSSSGNTTAAAQTTSGAAGTVLVSPITGLVMLGALAMSLV